MLILEKKKTQTEKKEHLGGNRTRDFWNRKHALEIWKKKNTHEKKENLRDIQTRDSRGQERALEMFPFDYYCCSATCMYQYHKRKKRSILAGIELGTPGAESMHLTFGRRKAHKKKKSVLAGFELRTFGAKSAHLKCFLLTTTAVLRLVFTSTR